MTLDLKIYSIYFNAPKSQDPYLENDFVIPIQGGRALNSPIKGMIGDDTGDTISKLNLFFGELTVLYWVWKQKPARYVGFMHYRRFFYFNTSAFYKTPHFPFNYQQNIFNKIYNA